MSEENILEDTPENPGKPNLESLLDVHINPEIEEDPTDPTERLIEVGEPIVNNPIPVVKSSKKFIPVHSDNIEKIFGQLVNTNPNGIFVEPNCPICLCKYRHNVEAAFAQQEVKNFTLLQMLLKNKEDLQVSIAVIENHIYNHSCKGSQELQKLEYIAKIRRLSSSGLTTLDQIQLSADMIYERILETGSLSADKDTSPLAVLQIKNQDIAKLTKLLLELAKARADILGELKSTGQVVSLEQNAFIEAFNEAMKNARTDAERKNLKSLLEMIHQSNKG